MKLAVSLLLAISLLHAAAWDGTSGDLAVATFSYDVGPFLGLAWSIPSTRIQVSSTDRTATAFRVTIRFRNVIGQAEERSALADVPPVPFTGAAEFWGVPEASIEKVWVTKLHDGDKLPIGY